MRIDDLVPFAGGNGNGIAGAYIRFFRLYLNLSPTLEDVVDFLRVWMSMGSCRTTGSKTSFGQTLFLYARVTIGQKFSDFRPVFCGKDGYPINIVNIHG
jgi:hypothetical protein